MTPPDRVQLKRLLIWQAAVAVMVSAAAVPFGMDALLAAAIGAGGCLLANWYFAFRVFQRYEAQEPGRLLARIYGAELVKIVIALAVFGLAFATLDELNPLALFGAYLAVQIVPALFAQRPDARSNS
ncbi:MAG: F0F1 ATP synthase assembly protein I [Gammaproteobacteria bacterium]|nr:F0F1 ATP synthase assembly protein I [Gammaproteobacteria bacterium]